MIRFEWNETKASHNWAKHKVTFETAQFVFDDPYAITEFDHVERGEKRWRTIGLIGASVVLLVAHTFEEGDIETVRIISARRATRQERIRYEANRQEAW